ncbi:MAG: hypothetical protein MRY79_04840 [Alphaproteobacteria bacterium]|nr:hypothetical protein [Alphaproteobacteria bacterium]
MLFTSYNSWALPGSSGGAGGLGGNSLPGNITGPLGQFSNLGNISPSNLGQVFQNPQISQALGGMLQQGGAGQALQAIGQIANIAGGQGLQQLAGGLGGQLGQQLGGQALQQLGGQAFQQLGGQLAQQLGGQLAGQLGQQLGGQLAQQLGGQLAGQLGQQVLGQMAGQALQQIAGQLLNSIPGISQALQALGINPQQALSAIAGGLTGQQTQTQQQQQQQQQEPKQTEQQKKNCQSCSCTVCQPVIANNHNRIRTHMTSEFEQYRSWLVTTYFLENILPAMMLMSDQFANTMMQQVQVIGTFFDAKHQLETQRLMQQMTAKAHKDYHPSESLCEIGTNIRSLAASERKSDLTHAGLSKRLMDRQLSSGDSVATKGEESDRRSRLDFFIKTYCNKDDNGIGGQGNPNGLELLCKDGGGPKERQNMDVNYTNVIENNLTLEIDFSKDGANQVTDDEEDVFALSANLMAHQVLPTTGKRLLADGNGNPLDLAHKYMDLRSVAAKRSVALNSLSAVTALRAEGDDEVAPFLKAILIELGINKNEMDEYIGKKPSYFAQMEVMTKHIYQNPTFYANLYDKPANVERKGIALQAIGLMQDRDIYKSLLRSEAVLATLIETLMQEEYDRVWDNMSGVIAETGP